MSIDSYPDPQNPAYPDVRDHHLAKLQQRFVEITGIDLLPFQKMFLNPPPPYDIRTLKLIQMGAAKRIGKSWILGFRGCIGAPLPHHRTRIYGPEHELAKREFDHIDYFLFKGQNAIAKQFPLLKQELVDYNADPSQGQLVMRWSWDSEITSRSWERRNQWVGEPVDLAIISEPGLFPDGTVFSGRIEPNLQDRRGVCYSSGTVDNPWMFDYHQMGHCHEENPDIFCICEIPRWANPYIFEHLREEGMDAEDLKLAIRGEIKRARERLTARDFAINWQGHWDNYSNIAIENWEPKKHVKIVTKEAHRNLEMLPAGWDHFLALDPGGYIAMGEFVVNPKGFVLMINEWCNYEYRAGQIVQVDYQGFKDFFSMVLREIMSRRVGMNRPVLYGDPAWQDKLSVTNQGVGWVDAMNAHDASVNIMNEYLGRNLFMAVRPEGREPYMIEREIPRVKWRNDARRKLDDATRGHSFDQCRYGLSSRQIAEPYVPDRPLTLIQKDIQAHSMLKGGADGSDPLHGDDGLG